jgi:orotate phosphoribosyltransferase
MGSSQDREQLKRLLAQLSVRTGEFVLVSGKRSSVYVDAKLTTCRAAAMPLIGRLFLDKIIERDWQPDAVGGLTMGADPICLSIARESLERGLEIDCFLVRKEPKKHGTMKFIEGLAPDSRLDVVIIDDVCTSGGSTRIAIQHARDEGLRVLGAICLVDREEGAREAIEDELGCPFARIFTLSELTVPLESGAAQALRQYPAHAASTGPPQS